MNLLYIENMNRLTDKIIQLRSKADERARRPAHPRVGAWRHQMNVERLRLEAEHLEKKRMLLLKPAVREHHG